MNIKVNPTSALVFYCPYLPDRPVPHVDHIAKNGCSGQLMLEEGTEFSDLQQLLGMCSDEGSSLQQVRNERFNGMPIDLVSSSSDLSPIISGIKVVDFTNIKNAWEEIDSACSLSQPNTLICVVSEIKADTFTTGFLPQQSYFMKNGKRVKGVKSGYSLIYSYFHSGSTRQDSTERFGLDVVQKGGNKKILAWHFFAEIGCKLGFVEKYGA
ncbi:hypothetical protein BY458DRAFT_525869 [Sporodiniella umbellata]|nr:hypothetical protein BY458DRAFT_525869 [Sporodiniella umbellata]